MDRRRADLLDRIALALFGARPATRCGGWRRSTISKAGARRWPRWRGRPPLPVPRWA
ncbi:MAG: hypothetical protein JKP98_03575 [Rhodobacteraceae bacterium]|nr:hypothetical protein [Paracoccaceae bacterium]